MAGGKDKFWEALNIQKYFVSLFTKQYVYIVKQF